MAADDLSSMKTCFYMDLAKILENKSKNSGFMTKQKYTELINIITELKNKHTGKTPGDYQKLKRYDIKEKGDCKKLIYPLNEKNPNVRYYIHNEELFDTIHETHIAICHGGRNRMMKELQKKYKNITAETVMVYINLCIACQSKAKIHKKNHLEKPVAFNETSRGQVDLIDMPNQHKEFQFILVYQDLLTKFVQLRPLKSKRFDEVAYILLDIFTTFGAPCVLQSEFSNKIVEELRSTWDELRIVHGKPQNSLSDHTKEEVTNLVSNWLETNQTANWCEGLRFVQLAKNRTYCEEIKCSPFEAMFRTPTTGGLISPTVDTSEEDIEKILKIEIENDDYEIDYARHYLENLTENEVSETKEIVEGQAFKKQKIL